MPVGSQPVYSTTAGKMAMACNVYVHPQKASLFFSEPLQCLLAAGLYVGDLHERERQAV